MGLKELFLNKGWAGTTMSRQETVERVNPLIRQHYELNHSYEYAIRTLDRSDAVDELNQLQKKARADIGKLSETVLSAGGASYNGTDLEADQFDLGSSPKGVLDELHRLESNFEHALNEELGMEHQIRTRAILGAVLKNSQERLSYLDGLRRSIR